MGTPVDIPRVSFVVERAAESGEPLRSDVLGVVGRCRRGPVGRLIRVAGWQEYLATFGPIDRAALTSFALRGYFSNGGEVAHVYRVPRPNMASARSREWTLDPVAGAGFRRSAYHFEATSPGRWANGGSITPRFRLGPLGPRVELVIRCAREPVEHLEDLEPEHIVEQVAARSRLVRLLDAGIEQLPAAYPRHHRWDELALAGGTEGDVPTTTDYDAALDALIDEDEVALMAAPDLWSELSTQDWGSGERWLLAALIACDALHDRLVLVDPPIGESPEDFADRLDRLRAEAGRSGAAYLPWLRVANPSGGIREPLASVPPSGHVAGLISRLDRERGAWISPANASLHEIVDLDATLSPEQMQLTYASGANLLRCQPTRGVVVWGARTIVDRRREPEHRFVAHRRLIHRLVRAFRRAAEPLVFETNGPELWLALVRALTSVLLVAWRGGALAGARAEEAFVLRCDETTNPPELVELGQCVCELDVAPATPMEFIRLRVALRRDGSLEVT